MTKLRFVLTLMSVALLGQLAQGEELAGGDTYAGDYYATDCDCYGHGGGHSGCAAAGNMPQHHRYFPRSHGHYYFRPYNYHTILRHQHAVARYGGDPRNPYSNDIFADIYAEFANPQAERSEQLPLPPEPPASPFVDDAASLPPAPSVLKFSSRRRVKDAPELVLPVNLHD